jgi:hypothetical protein
MSAITYAEEGHTRIHAHITQPMHTQRLVIFAEKQREKPDK